MSEIIPRSVQLALLRHSCEPDLATSYDGRIATALLAYASERLADGISTPSIRGMLLYPGAALLRLTEPGASLDSLDMDGTRSVVTLAVEAGYCPRTIRGKHLQLVRALLRRNGLPDFVTQVKRRMRSILGGQYLPPPRLTPSELADIFDRMENYPRRLPLRRRDLALIRLLALRAVRTFEFCRVEISTDVLHFGACLIIRQAKAGDFPRRIALSPLLAEDVRVLRGGRKEGPLLVGGPRKVNAILETWKRRLSEPRLNQRHLRRSCASSLSYQGAPLPVIRQTLGHAQGSPQTIRYLVDDEDRLCEELRRFEHSAHPQRSCSPESSALPQAHP